METQDSCDTCTRTTRLSAIFLQLSCFIFRTCFNFSDCGCDSRNLRRNVFTVCIYCFYSSQECLWAITDLFPQCSFNFLFRTVMLFYIHLFRLNKVLKPYRWGFSTSRIYLVLNPLQGKALARFCTHFPIYYVGKCMDSYLSNFYEILKLILGSFRLVRLLWNQRHLSFTRPLYGYFIK